MERRSHAGGLIAVLVDAGHQHRHSFPIDGGSLVITPEMSR